MSTIYKFQINYSKFHVNVTQGALILSHNGMTGSDYLLTITCARLYRGGVCEKVVLEGSYEITPFFQRDIDSLRRISPRFVAMLFVSAGRLAAVWFLSSQSVPELYAFASGSMILLQLTVHTRHLRNLFMFHAMSKSDCVRGRTEYSRPLHLADVVA
jgi:hypothetical protein